MKRIVTTAVWIVAATAATHAQSLLYVALRDGLPQTSSTSTLVELPLTPAGLGPVQRALTLPAFSSVRQPLVSYDGRYVVFATYSSGTGERLAVVDTRSWQLQLFDSPRPAGTLLADPTATRFFMVSQRAGITVIEPSGLRSISLPNIGSALTISSDGRELYVGRASGTSIFEPDTEIWVLDPLTGAERRRLPVLPSGSMALTPDAQRFYIVERGAADYSVVLRDARTGAELQRRDGLATGLFESIGELVVDEVHGRLFLHIRQQILAAGGGGGYLGRLQVVDATTLADVGTGGGLADFRFDHTQGVGVNVSNGYSSNFGWCSSIRLEIWGASNTPSLIPVPPAFAGRGICTEIALATPPTAPSMLSAHVVGRRVTLTWGAASGASEYQLEAGSATQFANIARVRVGATELVVDNVPPGTYYVRVRGLNEIGAGAPSNEIIVTVTN